MSGRIFISYRRGDSQGAAGRLFDRMLSHFDRDQLFIDVDAIEPGVDFVKFLDEQLANCGAFIAVIGPGWLSARNAGGERRLDNPNDYVRVEIESALRRDIRVIPVLVDGASMPPAKELPPSLEALSRRNAFEIAHHRFAADCDDLARGIKRALGMPTEPPAAAQALAGASPADDPAARKLSWAEILFSFRGRISRQQFLIGLLTVVAAFLALYLAISLTIDALLGGEGQPPEIAQKLTILDKRLLTILGIGIWWPLWALTLKRLHDFEHGWKTLLVFVAGDIASIVFDLLDQDEVSNYLAVFILGITFMLAAVKGSSGPNQYGPDPLAKPPSAA